VERGRLAQPDEWVLNPRREAARPRPLDCTGPGGAGKDAVRKAQEAWAKHMGRQVEETVTVGGVPVTFVLVPPGRFRMGSPREEQDALTRTFYGGSRPDWLAREAAHEVELTRPFYLGRYPVTQEQYAAVTGRPNPSHFAATGPVQSERQVAAGLDTRWFPVESVSWDDARGCADELTRKLGDGTVCRLPTEAEWEYACRGGRPASQPFGVGDGATLSSAQANFDGASPVFGAAKGPRLNRPCPVGQYPANALGLSDMHGNVCQWCADHYGDYPAGRATDPAGPGAGADRVIRGGSWTNHGAVCREAHRTWVSPDARTSFFGFRLARTVPADAGKGSP
jgi:formylglycine-generating enzyme required for sulfatase activity